MALLGTCIITSKRVSISTDEAMALSNTKSFKGDVNTPKMPNMIGNMIEPIRNGATVININLDFTISSSVKTKPPNIDSPT